MYAVLVTSNIIAMQHGIAISIRRILKYPNCVALMAFSKSDISGTSGILYDDVNKVSLG